MMAARLALLSLLALAAADTQKFEAQAAINPIRKVVNMLQSMQQTVEEEAKQSLATFDKFMCYCKTNGGGLESEIQAAKDKLEQLAASLVAATAQKKQQEAGEQQNQADRTAAREAMAEATSIRAQEKAVYDTRHNYLTTNIAAMDKAIPAISQGMAGHGSFLQSDAARSLKSMIQDRKNMLEGDRQDVLSFLSGNPFSQGYAAESGQIEGILKQIRDEMTADLKETIAVENKAIKDYNELIATKKAEVAQLTLSIEDKLGRIAELGVEIAAMENDQTDTEQQLADDIKFLADLKTRCGSASAEYEAQAKIRSQELVALTDTIRVLNDDDALDLFKKTLPSASSSLLQVQRSGAGLRARAAAMLEELGARSTTSKVRIDFISMALKGKKVGFDKVIALIEDLVKSLKQEQLDDNDKKDYCDNELDVTDDKKKALEHKIKNIDLVIAETEEAIRKTTEEINSLIAGIKATDKAVADATAQRMEEHKNYKELMSNDGAAKELLQFAQNRLAKFYSPKLYKAAPKRDLSEEDRIVVNEGGTLEPTDMPGGIANTGIDASFVQVSDADEVAPPPAPALTTYAKQSSTNGGVMSLLTLLIADLDKDMSEAKASENDAQADYEKMMKDAAVKRANDSKSVQDRESAKADLQSSLEESQSDHKGASTELAQTKQYIHEVHLECDWLLKYFDVRKEARAEEVDALGRAKAVLSGADYSLIQKTESTSEVFPHHAL